MFKFTPDPLFYTVGFEVREIKATEKQVNRLYQAGYLGLKKDESIATFCGMRVEEYRQLCINDPIAERAVFQGRVDSEARTSMKLLELANDGDMKAIQLKLTHQHDWMPAKPVNDTDATVTIVVKNAEPELEQDDA